MNFNRLSKLKKVFSTIAFKLFLSFWLITIFSIAITRFVSTQLIQESVIVPNHQSDMRKLSHLADRINQMNSSSISYILDHTSSPKGSSLLIRDDITHQVFYNKTRYLRNISSYLAKNSITQSTTVQFPHFRISGPANITVNNQPFQLYLAHRTKRPHFSSIIMSWPTWVHFLIPIFVSLFLCWVLAKTLTKPLSAIKNATVEIGKGNYKARVVKVANRGDELGSMANSFNIMAEKLETNISAHKRLLADVSHELRSPMTRLQMTLGLITKTLNNENKANEYIQRCEQEVMQLDSMINNILSLSRIENNAQQLRIEKADLHNLLSISKDNMKFLSERKSIDITFELNSQTIIDVDQTLFTCAMDNILTNAIRHSSDKSVITINCHFKLKHIVIAVSDEGSGVPINELEKIFTPFYRVSEARDAETGGTGLGLAITKHIIEMHKGKVSAQNNHSGGLTITLELPIQQS